MQKTDGEGEEGKDADDRKQGEERQDQPRGFVTGEHREGPDGSDQGKREQQHKTRAAGALRAIDSGGGHVAHLFT
ncbi:MAG: hypothetical protein NVS2B5_14150 [Beijerinckiaceae bacterium]